MAKEVVNTSQVACAVPSLKTFSEIRQKSGNPHAYPPQKSRIFSTPVCNEQVRIQNTGIIEHLCFEARQAVDPTGERWALFDRKSPKLIPTGSLLKLTYRSSASANPTTFTGVLLAIKRSIGDPTIILRGIVDEVAVEQEAKKSQKKLYCLRERPGEILSLQKTVQASKEASKTTHTRENPKPRNRKLNK